MRRLLDQNKALLPVLFFLLIAACYLFRLTNLPVFADEAIYIRWAQLIIDDATRYAFFPLNDGKTPLFIWLLVPLQFLHPDHLFAGRLASVISALGLVLINGQIVKEMGGNKRVVTITSILTAFLPFWFFSARLALIDITLVLLLALMVWGLLKFCNTKHWWYVFVAGFGFGLALWTKIPAILGLSLLILGFVPILTVSTKKNKPTWRMLTLALVSIVFLGLMLFALLKLHPAFGQLFSRGGDFLLASDQRTPTRLIANLFRNAGDFAQVFLTYLTTGGILFATTAIFLPKHRRTMLLLWLAVLGYCLPIMVLGKVVYPRYLLPAALPLTLLIAFGIENFLVAITQTTQIGKKMLMSGFVAIVLAQLVSLSSVFVLYSWLNPNRLPLTKSDREQYLSEWSAGNGIRETVMQIQTQAASQRILVLTEGYFGTLPDGILLYLHRTPVNNIFVEGIGQPVVSIPTKQLSQAATYDQVWLVVNSHRQKLNPAPAQRIGNYCRLPGDPCLEVWNITDYIRQLPSSP